jgi:hypothetical protein
VTAGLIVRRIHTPSPRRTITPARTRKLLRIGEIVRPVFSRLAAVDTAVLARLTPLLYNAIVRGAVGNVVTAPVWIVGSFPILSLDGQGERGHGNRQIFRPSSVQVEVEGEVVQRHVSIKTSFKTPQGDPISTWSAQVVASHMFVSEIDVSIPVFSTL